MVRNFCMGRWVGKHGTFLNIYDFSLYLSKGTLWEDFKVEDSYRKKRLTTISAFKNVLKKV